MEPVSDPLGPAASSDAYTPLDVTQPLTFRASMRDGRPSLHTLHEFCVAFEELELAWRLVPLRLSHRMSRMALSGGVVALPTELPVKRIWQGIARERRDGAGAADNGDPPPPPPDVAAQAWGSLGLSAS